MSAKLPSKRLSDGKAYACPQCSQPMYPGSLNIDMSHCFACQLDIDWWYPPVNTPAIIDVPMGSFREPILSIESIKKASFWQRLMSWLVR